jgi:putative membrane protein
MSRAIGHRICKNPFNLLGATHCRAGQVQQQLLWGGAAMRTGRKRTIVLASAVGALALFARYVGAQQNTQNNPGDIKPAQQNPPAAHPTGPSNSGERQVSDQPNSTAPRDTTEQSRTEGTRRTANRSERNDRDSNLDRQLAACLLTKNKGEVELGKYAAERAKDRDVKEFAEQMVKDHSSVAEQLEQLVGSQPPNDRRSQIAREIDEECLASLKKELGNKSDKEFDVAYIGSQIGGHLEMAATLKVVSEHASGQLSQIVNDARPTVDKHLQHAKRLMDQHNSRDHAQASNDRSERTR